MTTLVREQDPSAVEVTVDETALTVTLQDGRQLRVPLSPYPRLQAGTPAERDTWEILGDGYAVAWPGLDEHIGVERLLAGRRSAKAGGVRAVAGGASTVKRYLRTGANPKCMM